MKQTLLTILFVVLSLTVTAQTQLQVDQLHAAWLTKTITGVKGGDIIQLAEAFNKTYPSKSLTDLLDYVHANKFYDQRFIVEVDRSNGWLQLQPAVLGSSVGGDYDAETDLVVSDSPDAEFVQACVWRRSNGHRLFAVSFHQSSSMVKTFVAFFDYDPDARTLTPDKSLLHLFNPLFPTTNITVELPQEGKELVITEDFPEGAYCPIRHIYDWDGMRPANEKIEFGNMEMFVKLYKEFCVAEEPFMTEYALYDVDEDGVPELLLSADNPFGGNYIGIYAMNNGHIDLLCGSDNHVSLSYYRHAVCYSGHAGTAAMMAGYVPVKNSKMLFRLVDLQEWDNSLDDFGPSTYLKDGEEVPAAEAETFIRSLGPARIPELQWHKIFYRAAE
jgi:hypothetical protein